MCRGGTRIRRRGLLDRVIAPRVLGHRAGLACAEQIADSVARSVCDLVRTTTVLSRCDRGADEKWRRQSSEYGPVNAGRASTESNEMRPLRYSINVTLDGCCHHEAGLPPNEESMRYWTAENERADALIFGRVTVGGRSGIGWHFRCRRRCIG